MDTKTPFVSDEQIAKVMAAEFTRTRDHVVACGAARAMRNIYEAELQALRNRVEPRDRILQELVDALANVSKESEGIGTIVCNCGAAATGIQLATNSALAKAKEQFGIEPSKLK